MSEAGETSGARGQDRARSSRVELFGITVDALTLDDAVARAIELAAADRPARHASIDRELVTLMSDNPGLARVVDGADLVTGEGSGLLWSTRLLRRPLPQGVSGRTLANRLLATSEDDGHRVFLLGSTQADLDDATQQLRRQRPGVTLAGTHHGHWAPDELDAVVDTVRSAEPRFLLAAMASPHVHYWLDRHLARLGAGLAVAVGPTFDLGGLLAENQDARGGAWRRR